MHRAIKSPIITYKSTQLAQKKCYTFLVSPSASKDQIAAEFEEIFKAKVTRVNTVRKLSKARRTRKGKSQPQDMKKAYIYSDIELDIFPKLQ